MHSLYMGLVDYWPLHEQSGDRYGNNDDTDILIDFNTVGYTAGPVVYAADFLTASSEALYIATADCGRLTFNGHLPVTVAAWAKPDSTAGVYHLIADKGYGGSPPASRWGLGWDASSDRFFFIAATTKAISAVKSLSSWYFVVGWHDPDADTLNVKVDTDVVATQAYAVGLTDGAPSGFAVGASGPYTAGTPDRGYLTGQVAEVAIWNRLLSSSEIDWLYNKGRGRTWPFDGRPSPALGGRRLRQTMAERIR